jgi:hypothetical protein
VARQAAAERANREYSEAFERRVFHKPVRARKAGKTAAHGTGLSPELASARRLSTSVEILWGVSKIPAK